MWVRGFKRVLDRFDVIIYQLECSIKEPPILLPYTPLHCVVRGESWQKDPAFKNGYLCLFAGVIDIFHTQMVKAKKAKIKRQAAAASTLKTHHSNIVQKCHGHRVDFLGRSLGRGVHLSACQ